TNGRSWNFDPLAGGLVSSSGLTVDPFGNNCTSATPRDSLFPLGGLQFAGSPTWTNCTPNGNAETIPAEHSDFAPRAGAAWDVFGNGRTIVRAGSGLFWNQLPVNDTSQLIFNQPVAGNNAIYGQIIDNHACPKAVFPF